MSSFFLRCSAGNGTLEILTSTPTVRVYRINLSTIKTKGTTVCLSGHVSLFWNMKGASICLSGIRNLPTWLSSWAKAQGLKINKLTSAYIPYLSNNARGVVLCGQYTKAKGCSYAQRNAEGLDTVVSRGILAIYHKPQRFLIAIIYHSCQAISIPSL